ncbi:MAG: TVP38/TMEM64 family protein [Elusimicrobia bacterium]|nr:TVP38/TMEM64 family protein [Elusimicrobiota bacterium]
MADFLQHALAYVAALGAAGWALFIVLYAACCVFFLPVSPLTFGAGAAYGLGRGFLLVWCGASLGAGVSFFIGRRWLRAWVEKKLARHPRFAAIDAAVSAGGARIVLLTRLAPVFPFATLNYAYGLTRVKFRDYLLASVAGMVPGTLFFVYLGAAAGAAFKSGAEGKARTAAEWAYFAFGLLATAAVVALVGREANRELAKHEKRR